MSKRTYRMPEGTPLIVSEPALAYKKYLRKETREELRQSVIYAIKEAEQGGGIPIEEIERMEECEW